MSSMKVSCLSTPSRFTSGFAQNTTGVSSWLTHALRKVTVRCPSKKYWGGVRTGRYPPRVRTTVQAFRYAAPNLGSF